MKPAAGQVAAHDEIMKLNKSYSENYCLAA